MLASQIRTSSFHTYRVVFRANPPDKRQNEKAAGKKKIPSPVGIVLEDVDIHAEKTLRSVSLCPKARTGWRTDAKMAGRKMN